MGGTPAPAPAPAAQLGGTRQSPERVLPRAFALFGGAAGLFAILTLGAFREPAREVLPLAPLIATAAVGALAGLVLGRLQPKDGHELPFEVALVRVGATSTVAGALSGALAALCLSGEQMTATLLESALAARRRASSWADDR